MTTVIALKKLIKLNLAKKIIIHWLFVLLIYLGFYLKRDVLLLAVAYQNFRKESATSFKLDSLHYMSTPGYSSEAMEKFTGVRLKLISDIEKEQFVESIIRGGNSIISKGYAGANKKILKLRGPNKPTLYSIYLNANNLYGHSI